jgi:hypothetical protein
VAVQPDTQIVDSMVACVTVALSAPGVMTGSGSPGRRSAVEPGTPEANGSPVGPGEKEAPGSELAPDSSSSSMGVALGATAEGGAEAEADAVEV